MLATDFNAAGVLAGGTVIAASVIIKMLFGLSAKVDKIAEGHTVLLTTLTGVKGDNGLNGEVRTLRIRSHEHGDAIHGLQGAVKLHTVRLDTIASECDRRHGVPDRRTT